MALFLRFPGRDSNFGHLENETGAQFNKYGTMRWKTEMSCMHYRPSSQWSSCLAAKQPLNSCTAVRLQQKWSQVSTFHSIERNSTLFCLKASAWLLSTPCPMPIFKSSVPDGNPLHYRDPHSPDASRCCESLTASAAHRRHSDSAIHQTWIIQYPIRFWSFCGFYNDQGRKSDLAVRTHRLMDPALISTLFVKGTRIYSGMSPILCKTLHMYVFHHD